MASNWNKSPRVHLQILDNLQGIAMLLVVVGHLLAGNFVPFWYADGVRPFLYAFHMALFIFISGFLIRYSYRDVTSWRDYGRYVGKRVRKFAIPFVVVGSVIVLLVAWTKHYSPGEFFAAWWALLLTPSQSQAGFLWYIYILFFLYILSPLLFRHCRGRLSWLPLIPGIYFVLNPVASGVLALNHFCHFFLFYWLGVLTAEIPDFWSKLPSRFYWCGIVPFLIWCIFFYFNGSEPFSPIAGLCAIPAWAAVAFYLLSCRRMCRLLSIISVNCFVIYLFHMFVVQAGVRVAEAIHLRGTFSFFGYMIVIVGLGVAIPIICALAVAKWLRIWKNKQKKDVKPTEGSFHGGK